MCAAPRVVTRRRAWFSGRPCPARHMLRLTAQPLMWINRRMLGPFPSSARRRQTGQLATRFPSPHIKLVFYLVVPWCSPKIWISMMVFVWSNPLPSFRSPEPRASYGTIRPCSAAVLWSVPVCIIPSGFGETRRHTQYSSSLLVLTTPTVWHKRDELGLCGWAAALLRRHTCDTRDTSKTRPGRRVSNPLEPDVFSGKHLGQPVVSRPTEQHVQVFVCLQVGWKNTPEYPVKHVCQTRP
jgi:hypothetical protein